MHVVTDMNFGGAGNYLLDICNYIDKSQFEIIAVVPKDSILNKFLSGIEGVRLIEINGIDDKSFSLEGLKELYILIKNLKPDVIHSHACLSARVSAFLRGIKKVYYTRHCIQPKNYGIKKYKKLFVNLVLSNKVIAVSKAVRNNLIQEGIKDKDIFLIYNGVEIPTKTYNKEALLIKYGLSNQEILITLVGRLETVKGQEHLLSIVEILKEKLNGFRVILAGEGSNRAKLEEWIRSKNLPVELLGHISEIDEIYQLSDITVNTSNSEALSYAALEGFSHKKPVVAFNLDGINEVIEDGKDGYLVEFGDYMTFSDKLIELIGNRELRDSFGEYGYKKVVTMFSMDKMIKQIEEVWR